MNLQKSALNLAPVLFSDVVLTLTTKSNPALPIFSQKSLKKVISDQMYEVKIRHTSIEISVKIPEDAVNFEGTLTVTLNGQAVHNSPLVLGLDSNPGKGFLNFSKLSNVTRTGKNIEDLDESDINAMGYGPNHTKIMPEDQTMEEVLNAIEYGPNHAKISKYHSKIMPNGRVIEEENDENQPPKKGAPNVSFHQNTTI